MRIRVETASKKQLDELYRIETKCFDKDAYTKKDLFELLNAHNSISLIAKVDSEVIGFAIGEIFLGRNALRGTLVTIDVLPQWRRKGVGRKLLEGMEKILIRKHVKTAHLEVREDNIAAINLYRQLGYEEIRKLKNYYADADGSYMEKVLERRPIDRAHAVP
jgi:ribosomal-protein-alanine N-acetyltransferase